MHVVKRTDELVIGKATNRHRVWIAAHDHVSYVK